MSNLEKTDPKDYCSFCASEIESKDEPCEVCGYEESKEEHPVVKAGKHFAKVLERRLEEGLEEASPLIYKYRKFLQHNIVSKITGFKIHLSRNDFMDSTYNCEVFIFGEKLLDYRFKLESHE